LNKLATKILVFGKNGQLGRAFQETLKDQEQVIFVDRAMCDLTQPKQIERLLDQYQPQMIFNAAAYTAVDMAEKEPEIAFAVNSTAPEVMANYMSRIPQGVLVHFSTDYVFNGSKTLPYEETDTPDPLSQYGKSKLAGDVAIENIFATAPKNGANYFIIRTSWVYGDGANFIKTILRVMQEKTQLEVIADQYGVPTSAEWLARIAALLAQSSVDSGVYHTVPDGETTWYALACFVGQIASSLGITLKVLPEHILAIPATDYPLPAPRPYNSRMQNQKLKNTLVNSYLAIEFVHWQIPVQEYVKKITHSKD